VTTFAEQLLKARFTRGLNQKQVAERVGISPSIVSRYELGRGEPRLSVLRRLADVLDVTTDFLLGRAARAR
jgi:transcriptional regulator with XRE-family HTH domain